MTKSRCMFKRVKKGADAGKFRFRKGKKVKRCSPKPSTKKRHIKLHGDSGGPGHKKYAKAVYKSRVRSIEKARAATIPGKRSARRERISRSNSMLE